VWIAVGDAVATGEGVLVEPRVGVLEACGVGVAEGEAVGEAAGVGVLVGIAVAVAVAVGGVAPMRRSSISQTSLV